MDNVLEVGRKGLGDVDLGQWDRSGPNCSNYLGNQVEPGRGPSGSAALTRACSNHDAAGHIASRGLTAEKVVGRAVIKQVEPLLFAIYLSQFSDLVTKNDMKQKD